MARYCDDGKVRSSVMRIVQTVQCSKVKVKFSYHAMETYGMVEV
jgi:hypothetical protein